VYVSFNNSESRREGIIAINESGSGWATSFGDASGSVYEMTRSIKKIVFLVDRCSNYIRHYSYDGYTG
jgi:hypothetical protein